MRATARAAAARRRGVAARARASRGLLQDIFGGMRSMDKDKAAAAGGGTAYAVMDTVMESLNYSNEAPHLFRKERDPPLKWALHGQERRDEYAYLDRAEDPETAALLRAENAYLDRVLEQTGPVQERLRDEYLAVAAAMQDDAPEVDREGDYVYLERSVPGRPFPVLCRRLAPLDGGGEAAAAAGEEEVVLDMNAIAEERGIDYVHVPVMRVSGDNRRVAYVLDPVGDDSFSAHVRDIAAQTEDPLDLLPGAFSVEWSAGGGHVFYTLPDAKDRPHRVMLHRLGTPRSADTLLYEERDEAFVVDVALTKDRALLVITSCSKTTSEVRVVPAADEALEAGGAAAGPRLVEPRAEGVEYYVEHHAGHLYCVTNGGTEDGLGSRVVRRRVDAAGGAPWQEVLPDRRGVAIADVDVFERHLVLYERDAGEPRVRVLQLKPGAEEEEAGAAGGLVEVHDVPLPPGTAAVDPGAHSAYRAASIRLHVQSPSSPPTAYDYALDGGDGALRTASGRAPPAAVPPEAVTERVVARSDDGAEVPMTLYRRRDMRRNNRNPTLVLGYGAYGTPLEPRFDPAWVSLVRRGWVVAHAHVRGGGELGRRWYDGGRVQRKERSFADFEACADSLIDTGVTQPALLAAHGQSAGGLLLAAVANRRPELFKAMVLRVPFVDVLGSMTDEQHVLTAHEYREWGDPRDREAFDAILRYSPYDNIGTHAYPSMLVTAAALDARVDCSQPAKYVARLRDRMTNLDDAAVLLQTDLEGGHYGDSSREGRAEQRALELAFVAHSLGVPIQ